VARVTQVTAGPLFADDGPLGERVRRRVRGVAVEAVALVAVTLLFPLLLAAALAVDVVRRVVRGQPFTAVRLLAMGWWFLVGELRGLTGLARIYLVTGGPFGRRSLRRRALVYDLRIMWMSHHLAGVRRLFGLRFEVEGLELGGPGPAVLLARHASIIDNALPDALVGRAHGLGLRFVIKHELRVLPTLDIGGAWIPTSFVRRGTGDSAPEIARSARLAEDLGPGELVIIFPEGTRYTAPKLARVKERLRERRPDLAPLAEPLRHVLPPRLGGPLALLDAAPGADVVVLGHVGFDGFETLGDIWAGGLVGRTIRVKLWRHPAASVPAGDEERVRWLYARWRELDDWIAAQPVG
jgi:1-acyl-sn-glycerol-3-phosphate acyltransferase